MPSGPPTECDFFPKDAAAVDKIGGGLAGECRRLGWAQYRPVLVATAAESNILHCLAVLCVTETLGATRPPARPDRRRDQTAGEHARFYFSAYNLEHAATRHALQEE
jgi:hypothetical protein